MQIKTIGGKVHKKRKIEKKIVWGGHKYAKNVQDTNVIGPKTILRDLNGPKAAEEKKLKNVIFDRHQATQNFCLCNFL